MCGNFDARKREHRGREIDEADELIVDAGGNARGHFGPADHERHAQAGIVERSLRSRHAVAVIAPVKDDGVLGQPVCRELSQDLADLTIHVGDVVVHARELLANRGRVGVVRRNRDLRRIGDERLPFPRRARRKDLTLVRHLEVEHREERLALVRPVAPVRVGTEVVPDREGHAELVVGLRAIAGVVAGRAQILGKGLHVERRHREVRPGQLGHAVFGRPHVLRADRVLIHAGDDRGAARRAHRRRRERARVANGFLGQSIEHGRARERVAVDAEVRAHVFVRDPDDVGSRRGTADRAKALCHRCAAALCHRCVKALCHRCAEALCHDYGLLRCLRRRDPEQRKAAN